ncbi:hypothetical protein KBB49_00220 [Candidatus Saccharibacteria bacterium]|nr:hypothetical protein [Candidatus Saccharibacteria bacterium]
MQDEPVATESKVTESKVEESAGSESKVEEPVVEETPPPPVDPAPEPPPTPTPAPTPEPEIVPQPTIEPPQPTPEPIVEEPVPAPEPPKPPVKDEPVDKTEDRSTKVEDDAGSESKVESTLPVVEIPPTTPVVVPAVHDPKYLKDIPQKVLELTAEEINAARLLWAREHIGTAQAQANRSRTARMNERMSEIEKIVRGKPQISVHEIAKSVGLSEKLTSGYLQKLVHGGRLQATGNSWNRRFF